MPASNPPAAPPLGAVLDGRGVEFRLFSAHAERVELQLFERPDSAHPRRRVELSRGHGSVWHTRVEGEGPGTLYAYRVDGPFAPRDGHFFHPAKLLLDPWARAVTGEPAADPSLYGQPPGGRSDLDYDGRDSAAVMPKCIVVDTPPALDSSRPGTPWRDTVIYEIHTKGATRLHPDVPEPLRGTYAGLASEAMIEHYRRLGVTALELMPVHQGAPENHLLQQGRRNYWNYSPIAFFAPTAAYARDPLGGQVDELRDMVRALHAAGLEVLVDVVYNHTAEGGPGGPIYAFRGIDSRSYYRERGGWPHRPIDFTGTGNTLDVRRSIVRRLILESLRYWVEVLGVDGFRVDLAPVIGRDGGEDGHEFRAEAAIFEAIRADPVLARAKWIAEPWDLGPGGYRVGEFPEPWREWNDRFRDTARRFWCGDTEGAVTAELATRLAGSQDLYRERGPLASLNYVASHDGFTLRDWASYERKHNEANGEHNRDGTSNHSSRNWGVEGPSDDPEILARRARARRNLLATLLLSKGVPMLVHGDELGRTQRGNNNPYNQDNEITWTDWTDFDDSFFAFTRRLVALRRRYGALRRESFLVGRRQDAAVEEAVPDADVLWLGPDGRELAPEDWQRVENRTLAMALLPSTPESDEAPEGLLLLVNGGTEAVTFHFPPIVAVGRTTLLLDTARPEAHEDSAEGLEDWTVAGLSQVLLAFRPVVAVRRSS